MWLFALPQQKPGIKGRIFAKENRIIKWALKCSIDCPVICVAHAFSGFASLRIMWWSLHHSCPQAAGLIRDILILPPLFFIQTICHDRKYKCGFDNCLIKHLNMGSILFHSGYLHLSAANYRVLSPVWGSPGAICLKSAVFTSKIRVCLKPMISTEVLIS